VEKAYQQTKNFDKRSFLYLNTGSTDKMQKITDARGDPMSRFHNALYAGGILGRISVMQDVALCAFHSVLYINICFYPCQLPFHSF
jgi:coatomer protein complex subunit alpha (xenin)